MKKSSTLLIAFLTLVVILSAGIINGCALTSGQARDNSPTSVAGTNTGKGPRVPAGNRNLRSGSPGTTADNVSVQELTPQQLAKMLEEHKELVLIDVSTPGEFKQGHIQGSLQGDLVLLRTKTEEHLTSLGINKSDIIVLICETGSKSANTIPLLVATGYQNVYNLKGGKLAWLRAGYELNQ